MPRKHIAFTKKPLNPSRAPLRGAGGIKKSHRFRPGTVALRHIRKYQKSTELLIRKAPFIRIVRDTAERVSLSGIPMRFTAPSLEALQHAAEAFCVNLFEDTNKVAICCDKVTIMPKHVRCVLDLRNSDEERQSRVADENIVSKAAKLAYSNAMANAIAPDDDDASIVEPEIDE